MPRVVRVYITSAIIGFGVAGAFVGMVIAFNVVNLRHLIFTSDIGIMATLAFWILNGIMFSGVQFAFKMNQLADSSE
ncbi:hypothetical protein ROLI_024750 [Roseobacter fucihabitans]|uniref:Uncharacterized protein n=1 Tax=Roseobacter fucihabitans TaxID=1537242 RepID=A0ABZ2BTN0_9RHOB|nr:hypothetical protein [Roseobacter litoralis]MBC6965221.1 hypothetical protein [Roseobacter litoralis]